MKKIFAIAIAAVCIFATSCEKNVPTELMSRVSTTIEATDEGGSFNVIFFSNKDWTITSEDAWISVSPASGVASEQDVTCSVTVAASTSNDARTGKVIVTADDKTITYNVKQEGMPNYTELAGPANCYIIKNGGYYCFDATVMGNGSAGLHSTFAVKSASISPASAALLWEEVDGCITKVKLDGGKIKFKAEEKDFNAVIAASDNSGKILWSWHIWSLGEVNDVTCDSYVLMDRNLGAFETGTGEDARGLYFQWGRKDPFSTVLAFDSGSGEGKYHPVVGNEADATSTTIHTVEYSVAHPMEYIGASNRNNDWLIEPNQRYLWGLNWEVDGNPQYPVLKTIYDPCPKGYCVVSPTCLADGLAAGNELTSNNSVKLFGGKIVVPACGFIYMTGYGWWDNDGKGYGTLWTCSTAWGNTENAFRLKMNEDARDNYDRATGAPVRCMKMK
ncbi:MAG: BACON domain-containing protein [Bacteroidales bacterium]|nr:BACON domain-containing protein [Bacteroidales bacterium]